MASTQARLEMADAAGIPENDKAAIKGYNRDDCASTPRLRDWLEAVRASLIAKGAVIDRPVPKPAEISEKLDDWQKRVAALVARLTDGVPDDVAERTAEQQARWLLAFMLDWHGREKKAVWWEYFRLRDLSAEDLLHERAGLAGLTFLEQAGGTTKAPVHRYRFALQDTDIRPEAISGASAARSSDASSPFRTTTARSTSRSAETPRHSILRPSSPTSRSIREERRRVSRCGSDEYVADNGMEGEGDHRAARDLLMAIAPRLRGQSLQVDGESTLDGGDPDRARVSTERLSGAGTARRGQDLHGRPHDLRARARRKAGRDYGQQSQGHPQSSRRGRRRCGRSRSSDPLHSEGLRNKEDDLDSLQFTTKNEHSLDALRTNCAVGGGTSCFWARPDAALASTCCLSTKPRRCHWRTCWPSPRPHRASCFWEIPRQLEQPIQGSHPDGVDVSALDHILGPHATVPADRGLFLAETWRLHPLICAFNSELFYEGRLHSRPGLEHQEIRSTVRTQWRGTSLPSRRA